MSSLTIEWEYLTGYAVATDPSSRDRAEWPPHPGRVFLALAAAWFETEPLTAGDDGHAGWEAEGDALRWLETLGDPELCLPIVEPQFARSNVTVYVPVNDKAGPSSATLQSAPPLTRSKQARTFPRVWVGHEPCSMHWPQAGGADEHLDALDGLCRKVTRIGHTSSLVRMWLTNKVPELDQSTSAWVPDEILADQHLRVVTAGTLDALPEQTQIPRITRFADMDARIRASGGSEKRRAKEHFKEVFCVDWKNSMSPPPLRRPKLGIWRGYRFAEALAEEPRPPHSLFDTDLLILTQVDGPRIPLVSTLAVTQSLRKTIMSESGVQPSPGWVSGHQSNGDPLQSDNDGHLACIPLPFVGGPHADGHLLGVGLAFPRSVDRLTRARVLGKVLLDSSGQPKPLELKLGRLGIWTVQKSNWSETRWALAPESWTASQGAAAIWASVTPVVLDRFPKIDRAKNRQAWVDEVTAIIVAACVRIGLPAPSAVDIDTTSWHIGSPRAVCKHRRLRGHSDMPDVTLGAIGDGFPAFPAKGANAPRPQVHVWMEFPTPVVGPVLLGAGRYQGYGLCRRLGGAR
jgi:CRISPR-associated protein Csb2